MFIGFGRPRPRPRAGRPRAGRLPARADPAGVGEDADVFETGAGEPALDLGPGVPVLDRRREPVELVVDADPERVVGILPHRDLLRQPAQPGEAPEQAVRPDEAGECGPGRRVRQRVEQSVGDSGGHPAGGRHGRQQRTLEWLPFRLPVQVDLDLAARLEIAEQVAEGPLGVGEVVEDAERIDEVEALGREREPVEVGLDHLHGVERRGVAPRDLDGRAEVDGHDLGAEPGGLQGVAPAPAPAVEHALAPEELGSVRGEVFEEVPLPLRRISGKRLHS